MLLDAKRGPENIELRADSHMQMNWIYLIDDRETWDIGVAWSGRKYASDHRKQSSFPSSIGS